MSFQVAVVQATPVFFDLPATLVVVAEHTQSAALQGAQLVLFPESFLPGYPRGMSFGATVGNRTAEGREIWQMYWEQSMTIDSPEFNQLSKIAAANEIFLGIGITEKDNLKGSLYCTFLLIDPMGKLVHHHRKIKPTASERIIWGEGDGTSIKTVPTPLGRIGALICWENMMPLARTILYQAGIDIYLTPTADSRPRWAASMQHIAMEGRCYVLSANQYFLEKDYPDQVRKYISTDGQTTCSGGSLIVSPMGEILAGPLHNQEGILYAEIDLNEVVRSRLDFSAEGHYSRPDLFKLIHRKYEN